MSRELFITKRQAKTLLQAANEEKGVVEVKVGAIVFRLIPAVLAKEKEPVDEPLPGHM